VRAFHGILKRDKRDAEGRRWKKIGGKSQTSKETIKEQDPWVSYI